jgi:hypothetical protein
MNFNQLYRKIASINDSLHEGQVEDEKEDNEEVDECGMQLAPSQPEQPSSVSMSLNMNGSGVDGIRDLLDVLKSIDDSRGPNDDEPGDADDKLFGAPDVVIGNEEFANELDDETYDTDRILPTGDDLHSKGGPEPRKPAGGGNPYRQVDESLVNRLTNMYKAIKSSK